MALTTRTATVVLPEGGTAARRVDALVPGDVLLVAAGERLGADGLVSEGTSTFDAALVQRTDAGYELRGRPGGDESIGGEDFDDAVMGSYKREP